MLGPQEIVLVPIKNCLLVCYNLVGLVNASPIDYESQVIWGPISQIAATKSGVPDVCKTPSKEILATWSQLEG